MGWKRTPLEFWRSCRSCPTGSGIIAPSSRTCSVRTEFHVLRVSPSVLGAQFVSICSATRRSCGQTTAHFQLHEYKCDCEHNVGCKSDRGAVDPYAIGYRGEETHTCKDADRDRHGQGQRQINGHGHGYRRGHFYRHIYGWVTPFFRSRNHFGSRLRSLGPPVRGEPDSNIGAFSRWDPAFSEKRLGIFGWRRSHLKKSTRVRIQPGAPIIYPSIYLSIHLSIHLSIYLSIYLSMRCEPLVALLAWAACGLGSARSDEAYYYYYYSLSSLLLLLFLSSLLFDLLLSVRSPRPGRRPRPAPDSY